MGDQEEMGPRTNIMNLFTRSCGGTTVGPPWFCSQRPATCAEAVRVETQGLSILRTQEPGRPTGSLALNSEMGPWFGGQAMRPVPSNRPTCAAGRNFRSLRGPHVGTPAPAWLTCLIKGKRKRGEGLVRSHGRERPQAPPVKPPAQAPGGRGRRGAHSPRTSGRGVALPHWISQNPITPSHRPAIHIGRGL